MKTTLKHLFIPHYTNNHRARLLQPAGLTFLISLFLLAQTSIELLKAAPVLPGGFVLGYASNITPSEVINQTNVRRSESGLPGLRVSETLSQAATAKANHMFMHDYWAHVAPDGTTPWTFIKQAGYQYSVAGENLARDFEDTSSMIQAWMDSPTHRENILNAKYTEIGIAVVDGSLQGTTTTLVVQMFGQPASNAKAGQTNQTAATTNREPLLQAPVPTLIPTSIPTPLPDLATLEVRPLPENLPNTTLEPITSQPVPQSRLSPLLLSKALSTSFILLLVALLLYDLYAMKKQQLPRSVGKNWAHLTFYSVILVIIMALSQGKVL